MIIVDKMNKKLHQNIKIIFLYVSDVNTMFCSRFTSYFIAGKEEKKTHHTNAEMNIN